MKLMKCICAPGGTISVQGPNGGRSFGAGSVVDFDERVPGEQTTWGQALSPRYEHLFEPVKPASKNPKPVPPVENDSDK